MTPNQYRCETCKNPKCPVWIGENLQLSQKGKMRKTHHIIAVIETVGCASHSDFQSERDTVLDAVFASMDTFFGNIPMDSHIIQWAISKQDSFVTAAMATYLESRKLRQAGEP